MAIDLTILDESDGIDEEEIGRLPAHAKKSANHLRTYNNGSETIIDLAGANSFIYSGQQQRVNTVSVQFWC